MRAGRFEVTARISLYAAVRRHGRGSARGSRVAILVLTTLGWAADVAGLARADASNEVRREHMLRRMGWLAWGTPDWLGVDANNWKPHQLYQQAMLGTVEERSPAWVQARLRQARVVLVGDIHEVRFPKTVLDAVWTMAGGASAWSALALEQLHCSPDSGGRSSGWCHSCDVRDAEAELCGRRGVDSECLLPMVRRAVEARVRVLGVGGPSAAGYEGVVWSGRERRGFPAGKSSVDSSLEGVISDCIPGAARLPTLGVVGLGHAYLVAERFERELDSGAIMIVVPFDPLLECAWERRAVPADAWIEIEPGVIQAPRRGGVNRIGDLRDLSSRFESAGSRSELGTLSRRLIEATLRSSS